MEVPHTCEVGHNQPWFVCLVFLNQEKKDTITPLKLLDFSYSSKRFDYITNYQEVDWRLYRKFCSFMKENTEQFTLHDITEITKSVKKINSECKNNFFGNYAATQDQLKGIDYAPSHFRHVSDHCDKPWYECY